MLPPGLRAKLVIPRNPHSHTTWTRALRGDLITDIIGWVSNSLWALGFLKANSLLKARGKNVVIGLVKLKLV